MKAKFLNENCACLTLDPGLLKAELESDELLKGIDPQLLSGRPNLFSATTVFISHNQQEAMTATINAVEKTIHNPNFQNLVLGRAPLVSQMDKGTKGVFMGYDFHLSEEGPKLIEINTNAGGALLNLELAKAQQACCLDSDLFLKHQEELLGLDKVFYDMFLNEWELQRGPAPLNLIAIVDDAPESQYLYPEFKLFERLFTKFGTKTVIADPKDLTLRDGLLWFKAERVDLVYNRLTDFYLQEGTHVVLRTAFEKNAIVLTPSPRQHALYAHKLNLVALSTKSKLIGLHVTEKELECLIAGVPKTEEVTKSNSTDLWDRRRELFFKPVSGFGSKAAYRGEKITRRVWDEILLGHYVAQALIPPSKRLILIDGKHIDLKIDIRAYVYDGKIQLFAARLYMGQTTNFRTSGGGFAPVFVT